MHYRKGWCAVAVAALASEAYAGAWTQEAGHGQLIATGLYYTASSLYTNQGRKRHQPRYDKYELNPYFEYGVWDGVTAGANLSLQRTSQDASASAPGHSNWGVGDSEFFLRARLWQKDGFALAAEPMVKLPSPDASSDQPRLGGSHPDMGMGLSAGYGFSAYGLSHFVDLDTQYRARLGAPKDQVKLAATAGISLTQQIMLMPQLFFTFRTSSPQAASFTQSSADDYNLIKGQLSALYKLTPDVSLQLGGFVDIDGRNSGSGKGALVSVWKTF